MMERVRRIFSKVEDVDAIIVMNDVSPFVDLSYYYVTGATSGLFEAATAILKEGSMKILVSELEETSAREAGGDVEIFKNREDRKELLKASLEGVKRLGVNGSALTYRSSRAIQQLFPDIELVDVGSAIEAARLVKDREEVDLIRKACHISAKASEHIPGFLREGTREYEAAAEIEYIMRKMGASSIAFETISAFGPNAAEPHYLTGDRKLRKGETALFDFGCAYRKYCSDITRTFFVGEADREMERIYGIVKEAQLAGIDAIRPGATGKEVDAAAREIIDSTEYKGRFIHSFGHGVGLAVHDGGSAGPRSELVLEEDMIITAEPGIYIPGKGGVRIEDTVRVTKEGCEILTPSSKDLVVI